MVAQCGRHHGLAVLVAGVIQGQPGIQLHQFVVGVGGVDSGLATQKGEIGGDLLIAEPLEERESLGLLGGTAADA